MSLSRVEKRVCTFVICWYLLLSAPETEFHLKAHSCWPGLPLGLTWRCSLCASSTPPVLLGHSEGSKAIVTKKKWSLSYTQDQGIYDLGCPFQW